MTREGVHDPACVPRLRRDCDGQGGDQPYGLALPVIGALLGHRETRTTQRYAHYADDPLRAASVAIGEQIAAAMGERCQAGFLSFRRES
jgi:hypothetical protein